MDHALRQLFDAAKQNKGTFCDEADVLAALFEDHGEALIEALELASRALRVGDVDALPTLEALLAKLEAEAQP